VSRAVTNINVVLRLLGEQVYLNVQKMTTVGYLTVLYNCRNYIVSNFMTRYAGLTVNFKGSARLRSGPFKETVLLSTRKR
jgi:hypothetical protein